jgi:hypothetical protein
MSRTDGHLGGLAITLSLATLLLVVGLAAPAAATQCILTATDFQSLQLSKSGIKTQAEVDALPEARRELLCRTRAQWNQIQSSGQLPDDTDYSPSYLSPKERTVYQRLMTAFVLALPPEEWTRTRQQILKSLGP